MGHWLNLSYTITTNTPVYGDSEPFSSTTVKSLNRGDNCNSQKWSLTNHIGTHIDFPKHFVNNGKKFTDYSPNFWVCRNVRILEITPVLPDAVITPEQLHMDLLPYNLELLLIKTNFSKYRQTSIYTQNNPSFLPDIANTLRQQCPELRIFGFDTISLSSWGNRSLGQEAHRAFLDHENPILILEDVNLADTNQKTNISQIIIAPLPVADSDASPCLILAELS